MQDFPALQPQIVFLQCDWRRKNSLQKVIHVNEARGIGQMSPDSLLLGAWGLGTRLAILLINVAKRARGQCSIFSTVQ